MNHASDYGYSIDGQLPAWSERATTEEYKTHRRDVAPDIAGEYIDAHHDQTLRDMGRWSVIAKTDREHVDALDVGSTPLYTYK